MAGLKTLLTPELGVIQAALDIANVNLEAGEYVALTGSHLDAIDRAMGKLASRRGQRGAWSAHSVEIEAIRNDLVTVREWLDAIIDKRRLSDEQHAEWCESVQAYEGMPRPARDPKTGLLHIEVDWQFTGVRAVITAAVLVLLDRRLQVAGRLYHCGYSKCGKYGFDRSGTRGTHSGYCPGTTHGGNARAERKRALDAKKRADAARKHK